MRSVRSPQVASLVVALGLLAGHAASRAEVQAPVGGGLPVGSTPARTAKTVDLANRYRLVERHPRDDGRPLPGTIGTYRVGLIEVVKDAIDQPQGAPRRAETTRQAVFLERAAEQPGLGGVIGSVRTYENFAVRPDDPARTMGPDPLDGLTVGLRYRSGDHPILSPVAERRPTDYEYEVITRQMAVAQLGSLLPGPAVRIGDSWRISRRGAQALLGDPSVQGENLAGKFAELRKEVDGPRMVALIGVSGRVGTSAGEVAVNAEVLFTFDPEVARPPTARPAAATEGLIEAWGAITEVRMGRTTTGPLPGPGRLRYQSTREVTMHRQLDPGPAAAPLPKLPPLPRPEDLRGWLTWVDPARRFQLEHPQEFLPPERHALATGDSGAAVLVRNRREGGDLVQVEFSAKSLSPEDLKARLAAEYAKTKLKVIEGDATWLAEVEWPGRKVHRIESAVEAPGPDPGPGGRPARIHFDGYLIQTPQAASLLAIVTTSREPAAPVRREVERFLRTIQIDPPRPESPR